MFDGAPESGRILLVDDDALLRGALERVLGRRGWTVVAAADGLDARARLKEGVFDVVISDVNMPGYGGLQFLRAVRERDPHMPVILMTGKPSVESSIGAIEHGVFRYLVKPVRSDILEDVVSRAARLHRLARLNAQALEALDVDAGWPLDRTALEAAFARAIDRLWMAFQPIVSWRSRTTYGYEALMRSDEPELPTPLLVLGAAERLGRLDDLGRLVRRRVAERAAELPAGQKLFVNLHARDLGDDDLIDPNAPLSRIAGAAWCSR
ncbi:MAG: response regulator [Myxococcota bacterium]